MDPVRYLHGSIELKAHLTTNLDFVILLRQVRAGVCYPRSFVWLTLLIANHI